MARHDKYMSLTWHAHYIYNDYATRDVEADIFEADQIAQIIYIYIVYKQMQYIYIYICCEMQYSVKIQTSHNTKLLRFDTGPAKLLQQMMQIHLSQGVLNLTVS